MCMRSYDISSMKIYSAANLYFVNNQNHTNNTLSRKNKKQKKNIKTNLEQDTNPLLTAFNTPFALNKAYFNGGETTNS